VRSQESAPPKKCRVGHNISPTVHIALTYAAMPPYDSESSDEGEDYTETNVLLGYATEDATGDAVSHLGGAPVLLSHPTSTARH
jgi:hypothetical protein